MFDVQPLLDKLKERIEDPDRQALIVQIGVDLVEAQALRLSDPELAESLTRHLKAQALTLTATETKVLSDEFMAWITNATRVMLTAALGAI